MINLTIVGRVGGEPSVNNVSEDTVAINFDVVHSEKFKNSKGEMVERPIWVRCSIFRKPDKTGVKDYLNKGDVVLVSGTPSASGWQSNQEIKAGLNLRVDNLEFIHSKKSA